MLRESVDALALNPGCIAIDCTVGWGGHTEQMIKAVAPGGTILGFDRDSHSLELVSEKLSPIASALKVSLHLFHHPFSNLTSVVSDKFEKASGILADIGVSSMQLDQAHRGFSFRENGPLDMRMDPTQKLDAAEIVNNYPSESLTKIFFEYGEEPMSRKISAAIVANREKASFQTTKQLAELIHSALPKSYVRKSKKHPATKTFQALRIAVNDELGELQSLLRQAPLLLTKGGRLAVISFHSLEDRFVKKYFKKLSLPNAKAQGLDLAKLPILEADLEKAKYKIIRPFPQTPSEGQINQNPRARSAKLRILEKTED